MPPRARSPCRACGVVIKHRIAKLEARFRIDPRDTLVTPADVEGWRDMGIVVPDCRPGGESMMHWLEKCSDEALQRFMELHEQGSAST